MFSLKLSNYRTHRQRPLKTIARTGLVSVEMALVVPIILTTFFGLWEWSRVEMIRHVSQNACFEGVRMGTLPGYSESAVETKVESILDTYLIKDGTANANINLATGVCEVSVIIPLNGNLTIGNGFFKNKTFHYEMRLVQ